MNTENLKQLIRNLRRGNNVAQSKAEFFIEIEENTLYWCKKLSLRWLVSVVDTYIDHGLPHQQPLAMLISTYFNLVKIADTALLLTRPDDTRLPRLKTDVVYLYDEVNSLKIISDDMPNILFFRINKQLQESQTLLQLFTEIKTRLAHHSKMLNSVSQYHNGFYREIFFEGRKHFLTE